MTLAGLDNRDKPSASWFCEPGRCVIVKLYPCNWINFPCSLGGADAMGLLVIITRGRWLVMTLNSRPYKYVWNHCIPLYDRQEFVLDTGVSPLSGCKTLASIRDGFELAICISGCRSASPIPLKLASHCRYAGLRG